MNLTSYIKNLFIILWNIITFLCPLISQNSMQEKETAFFSCLTDVLNFLNNIYKNIKEITNKIRSKQNSNNAAKTSAVAKPINKNNNFISNIVNSNNTLINKAIKNANFLNSNKLKDVLATQTLISNSKQHFIPLEAIVIVYQSLLLQLDLSCITACSHDLKKVMTVTQDKCAYLYPFCKQESLQSINL